MAPALSTHSPNALDEALAENAALRKLVAQLMARIAELEAKLEASQARAKQNSQNSSRPPSSDPPDVKLGPKNEPTGRTPGGQPGHKGHKRELLPPDKVSRLEDHWPDECEQCRKDLRGRGIVTEVEPERRQVTDIPPVTPEVVEHRLHTVVCPRCDHATIATLPATSASAPCSRRCATAPARSISSRSTGSSCERQRGAKEHEAEQGTSCHEHDRCDQHLGDPTSAAALEHARERQPCEEEAHPEQRHEPRVRGLDRVRHVVVKRRAEAIEETQDSDDDEVRPQRARCFTKNRPSVIAPGPIENYLPPCHAQSSASA